MTSPDNSKAWEIAKSIGVCFLSTGESQYPMSAMVRKEKNAIYFLTDVASQKISEIGEGKAIQLTFSDKGSDEYLFVAGQASVSNDRAKISDLWSVFAQAWWDSADDPSIRLITVTGRVLGWAQPAGCGRQDAVCCRHGRSTRYGRQSQDFDVAEVSFIGTR